jgi:amphi-Trp domain-containing protein
VKTEHQWIFTPYHLSAACPDRYRYHEGYRRRHIEEILFETEERPAREESAVLLCNVADRLEAGGAVTLEARESSVSLDVPARPTFEVKAEREREGGASELAVEFEIEWNEDGEEDSGESGRLRIE